MRKEKGTAGAAIEIGKGQSARAEIVTGPIVRSTDEELQMIYRPIVEFKSESQRYRRPGFARTNIYL